MDQQDPSRVAVITGCGAGIGASVAQRFATDGDTVVLVGCTEATLRETVQGSPDGLFGARVFDDHFPRSTGSGREPA